MIEVSQTAATALRESLQFSGIEPNKGLRLTQDAENLLLEVDSPRESDRVVWFKKAPILIINRELEHSIGEGLIDVEEGIAVNHLVLRRENAAPHNEYGLPHSPAFSERCYETSAKS